MSPRTISALLLTCACAAILACGKSEAPAASSTGAPASAASGAKPPFGFLNSPKEGEVLQVGASTPTFASGWALADSGVAAVSVRFDDSQDGYVRTGFAFPGVQEQYPTYAGADKAGYMFAIPHLSAGPHSLTVTVRATDGSTAQVVRHFSIR